LDALTYYHVDGPAGDVFRHTRAGKLPRRRVGVVGLGVGSLACHGRRGERWVFFEIDPLVAGIATDSSRFTLLRDCPPDVRVVFGDARLRLAAEPDRSFDILVIDAFNSDAIPVHLLTVEAFEEYMRVLEPEGVLAIHISNDHMELAPLIGALAERVGAASRVRRDDAATSRHAPPTNRFPSVWAVLTRRAIALEGLAALGEWNPLPSSRGPAWTDDFSNILSVVRWRSHD
jgi:spermidine synthase